MANGVGRKVRARGAGKELGEPAHEELFRWLVDNLDSIVSHHLSAHPKRMQDLAEKANDRWREAASRELASLARLAEQYSEDAKLVALAEKHRKTLLSLLDSPFLLNGDDSKSLGAAKLLAWAAQHPVRDDVGSNYLDVHESKGQVVGYVDVCAKVEMVRQLELTPSMDRSSWLGGRDKDGIAKNLRTWHPKAPTWVRDTKSHDAWFDVRALPFVLGELLRDLKQLRDYLPAAHALIVLVVLVVPDCALADQKLLNHEGFWVLSRRLVDAAVTAARLPKSVTQPADARSRAGHGPQESRTARRDPSGQAEARRRRSRA
ncbi:hypothetical protein [Variovorax sp. RA8]|uniref:hypothetical protein n=1 Tax=Variovorax sp. (strain JCM 16519 / RA8) TaxID=662548 RepID=UPI0013A5B58B|nr:hypothetical protein [Variovorax sp. RA8]